MTRVELFWFQHRFSQRFYPMLQPSLSCLSIGKKQRCGQNPKQRHSSGPWPARLVSGRRPCVRNSSQREYATRRSAATDKKRERTEQRGERERERESAHGGALQEGSGTKLAFAVPGHGRCSSHQRQRRRRRRRGPNGLARRVQRSRRVLRR